MNHAEATRIYAGYINAPRGFLDTEEQEFFDQDLARARAEMERAWLTELSEMSDLPVLSVTEGASVCLTRFARISSALSDLREMLRRPSRRRKSR